MQSAGLGWHARRPSAAFAEGPAEAADAARRHLAASPWPAALARGADPPEPPAPRTPPTRARLPAATWPRPRAPARLPPRSTPPDPRRHGAVAAWPAVLAWGNAPREPLVPGTSAIGGGGGWLSWLHRWPAFTVRRSARRTARSRGRASRGPAVVVAVAGSSRGQNASTALRASESRTPHPMSSSVRSAGGLSVIYPRRTRVFRPGARSPPVD